MHPASKSRRIAGRGLIGIRLQVITSLQPPYSHPTLELHSITDPRPSKSVERITRWLDQCEKAAPNLQTLNVLLVARPPSDSKSAFTFAAL